MLLIHDDSRFARQLAVSLRRWSDRELAVEHRRAWEAAAGALLGGSYGAALWDLPQFCDALRANASLVARTACAAAAVVFDAHPDERLGLALIKAGAQDYVSLEQLQRPSIVRSLRFAIARHQRLTPLVDHVQRLQTGFQLAQEAMQRVLREPARHMV